MAYFSSTNLLILILTVIFLFYKYMRWKYNYWNRRGVKTLISPNIIFGNVGRILFARQTPDEFLQKLYKKGKDEKFLGFYVFKKPFIMVKDLELIKHVFIKDFANFSNKILGVDEQDTLGKTNLFLSKNPPWKHIRGKLTPAFSAIKLKKMLEIMLEIREDFYNYMETLEIDSRDGKVLEIYEINGMLMTDLIGITAFGMKFNSLTDPDAEFRKIGKTMFHSEYWRYLDLLSIFLVPVLRPFVKPRFFNNKGTDFFQRAFWDVINYRMKNGVKREDVIDILIDIIKNQEEGEDNDFKLEGDALVAQAAVFFSGGFESSSTTLAFLLYELAKNEEMQNRIRNEILQALDESKGKITIETLSSMEYAEMAVHETLRLYAILPWLDRVAEQDYIFPGTNVKIEKGTPCILPLRAIHMDPNIHHEPEKFIPERFSEQNRKNMHPLAYFPFGEGPRQCIGPRLGIMQVKLGLLFYLTKYEVILSERSEVPIKMSKFNILIHPSHGMPLKLRKLKL